MRKLLTSNLFAAWFCGVGSLVNLTSYWLDGNSRHLTGAAITGAFCVVNAVAFVLWGK